MGELPLVYVGMLAEEVGGDGVLQEGVPDGLQAFQVDGVVRVGHRQRLQERDFLLSSFSDITGGQRQKRAEMKDNK